MTEKLRLAVGYCLEAPFTNWVRVHPLNWEIVGSSKEPPDRSDPNHTWVTCHQYVAMLLYGGWPPPQPLVIRTSIAVLSQLTPLEAEYAFRYAGLAIRQATPKVSFEVACATYTERYTMNHVPDWAKDKIRGARYYAYLGPHFKSDKQWYDNTIFPPHSPHPTRPVSSNETYPLGMYLTKPFIPR